MMSRLVGLRRDGHIAHVTLERPDALNAISGAMADELTEVFRAVAQDRDVWVMVLEALGERAFCVGADLNERARFTLEQFHENRAQVRAMFSALRQVSQPTIASVFGFALGGGFELALSCDLIVAAEGTKFALPEARVGLLPAGGGTQLLTRKVGTARAKELVFLGRRIDAAEAQQAGLAVRVAPADELAAATLEVALDVCRSSPVAVRAAKWAIDGGLGLVIDDAIELENEAWKTVIESEDRAEGIRAFTEKRDPAWNNR